MSEKNSEKNKMIYIPRTDLHLWNQFAEKNHGSTSRVILKLIRLYLAGNLYDNRGKQIAGL